MLTYPWKCTVLHCNHLGNTWKPLVLMTWHFYYCPSASKGDNQSIRSSAPVVSRCFPGGYNVKLYISRGRLAWWLLAFLHSVGNLENQWCNFGTLLYLHDINFPHPDLFCCIHLSLIMHVFSCRYRLLKVVKWNSMNKMSWLYESELCVMCCGINLQTLITSAHVIL